MRCTVIWLSAVFIAQTNAFTWSTRLETLEDAAALIARHDLTGAEKILTSLLEHSPQDDLALNLLGVVRMQQNNAAEAEKLFRESLNSGHKVVGPHVNLARLYGLERPLDAMAELKEALRIAPANSEAASLLREIAKKAALPAIQSGDKEKALAILLKAVDAAPQDATLLYELGFVAYQSGLYRDAEKSLDKALIIQPHYPEATYELARTYLAENKAEQAENEMRKYLSEKPEDASAHYGLGYILLAEERIEQAKVEFERSLALQPNQTESIFKLGEIALQEGDNDTARTDFTKVLAKDAQHGGARTEMGILAYRAAKYEQAKGELQQAVANAPAYQKAHYYYALTLLKLGQKTEAQREFVIARGLQKEHGAAARLATQP